MPSSEEHVLIGISLGTLYTNVSVLNQDGQVQTIADHDGERNIPTCVSFTEHDTLCGTQAKIQSIRNFRNTITQFKSLLGKSIDDPIVFKHRKALKLNITSDPSNENMPAYCIEISSYENDEMKQVYYTPQQIMTIYLKSIKDVAESFSGKKVNGCVMTHPVHASKQQNDALMNAAKGAGFHTVFLIKEPIAAVFAYEMLFPIETSLSNGQVDKKILVTDFGGHQFNVTAVQESNGLYYVRASVDDFQLGGINMDSLLADHMAVEFKRKTRMDVTENRKSMMKLMKACEQTKKMLSQKDVAPCLVESLYEGMDLNINMNRGRFEILIDPMIAKCKQVIIETIQSSGWKLEEIDQIFVIGGSSRVPRFIKMMNDLFSSASTSADQDESSNNNTTKIMPPSIEPDEVVSQGCCCHVKTVLEYGVHRYEQLITNEASYRKVPALAKSIQLLASDTPIMTLSDSTPLPLLRKTKIGKDITNIRILEETTQVSEIDLGDWQEDIEEENGQGYLKLDIDVDMKVKLVIENDESNVIKEIFLN